MAIFSNKNEEEEKKDSAEKTESSDVKASGFSDSKHSRELANRVLVRPIITEKSHDLMTLNKYAFIVTKGSNKHHVKKAIEDLYGVGVENVRVLNFDPKKRNFGRIVGWKSGYRKAIVSLKKGDKIELFQGV